jgi:hypothetical protein
MTTMTNAAPAGTGTASRKSVGSLTLTSIRPSGCPCGCETTPSFDDPDCARYHPVGESQRWGSYDAADLGLVPHPRDLCAACQAVGK